MSFNVNLVGFKELQKELKELPERVEKKVDQEIGASMQEMKLKAQQAAPKDQSILYSEISFFRRRSLNWELVSQALHSAFIEFGTRSNVRIPPGITSDNVVQRAKSSLSAKEAIFAWCKRHGIEQRAWYAIYIKLMTKGITPRPYFFKQLEAERPQLISNVKSILDAERI